MLEYCSRQRYNYRLEFLLTMLYSPVLILITLRPSLGVKVMLFHLSLLASVFL